MTPAAGQTESAEGSGIGTFVTHYPVTCAWAAISLFLVLCHLAGYSPAGDLDDALKFVEIRNFLQSGAWFDLTIQGIAQPEPFVSHWVRLVDLPYAAVAAPLAWIVGSEAALAFACYIVPLLLLLPALYALRRIVGAFGFDRPVTAFFLSLLLMLSFLFEFAPDRIDYHNLELVFLLLAIAYTLGPRPPALLVGALTALTLAISLEFLLFFMLVMAVFAAGFVLGQEGADRRLCRFGAGLACTALLLYAAIVAPQNYGAVACDTYSTPHLLALVSAGISFIVAGSLSHRIDGPAGRAALLSLFGAASVTALILLFPECRAGPYGELSSYVKEQWLFEIGQEKNILQRADIVLSPSMAAVALLMIGLLAAPVFALHDRLRRRELTIYSLFCLLALLQALLYLRYFRYVALFASPAILLVLAACVPRLAEKGKILAGAMTRSLPPRMAVIGPGFILAAGLVAFHLMAHDARATPSSGADLAGSCDLSGAPSLQWPEGASILAPPVLGIQILAAEPGPGATIVATPHHRAWRVVERVYRFFDPRSQDPTEFLDRSKATHVAVCAGRDASLAGQEKSFPLTAALLRGDPPDWLSQCPFPASSRIRVYRYPAAGGAADACPTAPASTPG
jgi:hypothetical protein